MDELLLVIRLQLIAKDGGAGEATRPMAIAAVALAPLGR